MIKQKLKQLYNSIAKYKLGTMDVLAVKHDIQEAINEAIADHDRNLLRLTDDEFKPISDKLNQQIIDTYEAEKWHPYPEEKPEINQICWVTIDNYVTIMNWFKHERFGIKDNHVTAFIPYSPPKPYQPEGGEG